MAAKKMIYNIDQEVKVRGSNAQREENGSCSLTECLSKLGLKSGIAAFMLMIVLSFNLTAWNTRFIIYRASRQVITFYPGDVVSMTTLQPLVMNSALCEEFTIKTNEATVYTSLIDYGHVEEYYETVTRVVNFVQGVPDRPSIFYLLVNSVLRVSACSDQLDFDTVTIAQTQGFPNVQDKQTTKQFALNVEKACNKTIHMTKVSDHPNYYEVLVDGGQPFTGQLLVSVDRVNFRIKSLLGACYNQKECTMHVDYNTPFDIIIKFKDEPLDPYKSIGLSYDCQPRISFWIGIYVVPPFLICLLSLVFCCVCGRGSTHKPASRLSRGPRVMSLANQGFEDDI